MYQAIFNDQVIAESDQTIQIEGNQYFPESAVKMEFLKPSDLTSTCPWKGEAQYHTVVVGDQTAPDAAWYYAYPKPDAITQVGQDFSGYIAFWRDVEVKSIS